MVATTRVGITNSMELAPDNGASNIVEVLNSVDLVTDIRIGSPFTTTSQQTIFKKHCLAYKLATSKLMSKQRLKIKNIIMNVNTQSNLHKL